MRIMAERLSRGCSSWTTRWRSNVKAASAGSGDTWRESIRNRRWQPVRLGARVITQSHRLQVARFWRGYARGALEGLEEILLSSQEST